MHPFSLCQWIEPTDPGPGHCHEPVAHRLFSYCEHHLPTVAQKRSQYYNQDRADVELAGVTPEPESTTPTDEEPEDD